MRLVFVPIVAWTFAASAQPLLTGADAYGDWRVRFENGRPTGEYDDFLTGFVRSDRAVSGRPVGVTVAADGALLVSEDGNAAIWRIAYTGDRP